MKLKHIYMVLFFVASLTATAQNPYLQGNKSGGAGVPGTNSRSPLNSLERAGTGADPIAGATILTDTFGNQRYSYFVFVKDTCVLTSPTPTGNTTNLNSFVTKCGTDSTWYIDWTGRSSVLNTGGGAGGDNWYTVDDTTTDATRAAYILQNASWTGIDPDGYISLSMGDVSVGGVFIDATETNVTHTDVSGVEVVKAVSEGIEMVTSGSATKSILMNTDTVNWLGRFDATNFRVNFLSDYSYMYADSDKVVGIGQFPGFPGLNFDGTEKGIYYDSPSAITTINGNGNTGAVTYIETHKESVNVYSKGDNTGTNYTLLDLIGTVEDAEFFLETTDGVNTTSINGLTNGNGLNHFSTTTINFDGNLTINSNATDVSAWSGTVDDYALPVNTTVVLADLSGNTDLTGMDALDWEGRVLLLLNRSNTFTLTLKDLDGGSTAANQFNIGSDYVILPQRGVLLYYGLTSGDKWRVLNQYDASTGVNWYNSDGTTTDNTRIADVLQKAIWRSDDVTADGIYPFVFQLAGASPNEPEMMTWLFPNNDSLTLSQSDQEIVFTASNRFNIVSANELTLVGDSLAYQNLNGTIFKIDGQNSLSTGANARATLPNQVVHASGNFTTNGDAQGSEIVLRRSITGTAETELFLDGTSQQAVLAGTNRIWTGTAKCTGVVTAVGNGATIVAGDVFSQWQPFTIKRIGSTTTLMTPVFGTTVEGWSDASMGGSTFNISADDTTEALKITFVPPTLAGSTTVCRAVCTVDVNEVAY